MIPELRKWMYDRYHEGRFVIKGRYFDGVDYFCDSVGKEVFRCPCSKCLRGRFLDKDTVKYHLYKDGFEPHYWIWTDHGEEDVNGVNAWSRRQELHVASSSRPAVNVSVDVEGDEYVENEFNDRTAQMVDDAFDGAMLDEEPNVESKNFYDLLEDANTPICEGHPLSRLSAAVQMLTMKSEANQSEHSFDQWGSFVQQVAQGENDIPKNHYQAKKIFKKLGLKSITIDCCRKGCMLYRGDDAPLTVCKFCAEPRYKARQVGPGRYKDVPHKRMHYLPLIPRLKRLYASKSSAPHMTWHFYNPSVNTKMTHPSHGKAWQHFDQIYPEFAKEPRNVRLGLCSDGFSPNNLFSKTYSCWPVIVTPYNLPPDMCMKDPYLFLSCVIPGPSNPKAKIDVFLQPLIDELKELWTTGVPAYDVFKKQNFVLKASLLWTINDFPAYGMLSGWMTQGKLACPICMGDTKAFTLKHGGKQSWFDCHRRFLPPDHAFRKSKYGFLKNKMEHDEGPIRLSGRGTFREVRDLKKITEIDHVRGEGYGRLHNWTKRSIFWDLPYWKDNLVRHCLDVMHIEKNVFDNIMHTVMNTDLTKDNNKARMDLKELCKRPELNLQPVSGGRLGKPKAVYTLTKHQVQSVLIWLQGLKMPDGYASNLARCANVEQGKLVGMKSHDCHVFMQCLLPIAFKHLPKNVLKPLSDLSCFFRTLCSSTVDAEDLKVLKDNIPIILCSLEKVFPPAFFDVMEHLPVHLPYEAEMCGPVQYRWMYPFERCMGVFKRTVKNRARVEGSICEAFLTKETSFFCSYYFADHVSCNRTRVGRNDDGGASTSDGSIFSIFNQAGRVSGAQKEHYLTDEERKAAHSVVLLNCEEVLPYYEMFHEQFDGQADDDGSMFIQWFREYVRSNCREDKNLMSLSWGPLNRAMASPMYFVNGFKFHTSQYASRQRTDNSGVCVKGEYSNDGTTTDWYGVVKQILSLEYAHGAGPAMSVTLFGCDWFDASIHGTRYNDQYNIIEVNESRRYKGSDTFIVPQNAKQVYYAKYPSASQAAGWKAVIVTKPRGRIELNDKTVSAYQMPDPIIPPAKIYQSEEPGLLTNSLLEQDMEIVDPNNVVHDDRSDGDEDKEEEEEEEEKEQEEEEEEEFDDEESDSEDENENLYQSSSE